MFDLRFGILGFGGVWWSLFWWVDFRIGIGIDFGGEGRGGGRLLDSGDVG